MSACSWLVKTSSDTDVKLGLDTCICLTHCVTNHALYTLWHDVPCHAQRHSLCMHTSSNTVVNLRPGTYMSHSHVVLQIIHHTLGYITFDVMHIDTASSCIPAATPLWNSGQAVTSAAAPGTALAADRSKLKTALCCWGRRPAKHRSGMHNGSVGMGRSVPARTHSIQGAFSPPIHQLQRSNMPTAACPSWARCGPVPSARPPPMLRTDVWLCEGRM